MAHGGEEELDEERCVECGAKTDGGLCADEDCDLALCDGCLWRGQGYCVAHLREEPEEESPDLGACCACRQAGPTVRTLIMLPKRAWIRGSGWGCFQCGLPMDGAMVVVCDACLEAKAPYQDVIYGMPAEKARHSIHALSDEPFDHDMVKHPESWRWYDMGEDLAPCSICGEEVPVMARRADRRALLYLCARCVEAGALQVLSCMEAEEGGA